VHIKQYKNMKTKMKRQGSTELPRFAVGALAIAGASAANAAVVQITLSGNKISSTGGYQLVADLTGDGTADIIVGGDAGGNGNVARMINGGYVEFFYSPPRTMPFPPFVQGKFYMADASFAAGGVGAGRVSGGSPQSTTHLNPISFSDGMINGGAPTQGWLEVHAFNTSSTNHTIEFTRLIFDDASTTRPAFASIPGAQTAWSAVPEPSSLGLLALGAGGLLARRRRQAA
jgi:hypothetical protein